MTPSPEDPNVFIEASGAAVLARYDAVSSKLPAYAAEIRAAGIANGVDPLLLAALVRSESNFHPTAVSRCGAMGLTQLMPGTAAGLGVTSPYDVNQNLDGGARYIARQMKRFGRVDMALSAYNAGPGLVGRLGAVADGTKPYIRKILATWKRYQEPVA
jgi:soluble lytic murein transglycosylase-like protein